MKMRIVRAEAFPVELQLKEPFVIANETTKVAARAKFVVCI